MGYLPVFSFTALISTFTFKLICIKIRQNIHNLIHSPEHIHVWIKVVTLCAIDLKWSSARSTFLFGVLLHWSYFALIQFWVSAPLLTRATLISQQQMHSVCPITPMLYCFMVDSLLCCSTHDREVQTKPDRAWCFLWELDWLLHAHAGWQGYSHNKVLQIHFSHGMIPASVISDGVMWACLLVPACPWETLEEVLLWGGKRKEKCRSWHATAFLTCKRFRLRQSAVAPLSLFGPTQGCTLPFYAHISPLQSE